MLSVPVAAVEHWAYCPRQAALIHVDQEWEDNRSTAVGTLSHGVVDRGDIRHQPDRRLHHRVPVRSDIHYFHGVCDTVEEQLHTGALVPIEHKSGRVAAQPAVLQLALQAIAIEEMTNRAIDLGYVFLHGTRRRHAVDVADPALRAAALRAVSSTRTVLEAVSLPRPLNDHRCSPCSLQAICIPALS